MAPHAVESNKPPTDLPSTTINPTSEEDAATNAKAVESSLMHRSLISSPHKVSDASGSYLNLDDGRKVLDGCGGAAVTSIGHGNTEVFAAIAEQAGKVAYVHTGQYTTQSAEDLAEFILEGRPFGLSKAYFVCSGSEATDSSMKLGRQYFHEKGERKRTKFVSRKRAYHGNTLGAMSLSSNLARKQPYEDILPTNVSFVSAPNMYRGPADDETEEIYAQRLVQELNDEFKSLDPYTVIAFFAETVGGATAGCIQAPKGYYTGVRRVCDKYGILLVLDEVMCGTGRTGTYFAFEQEGNCVPDMVTIGKGLGGGYATIGGVLVHDRVIDALRKGSKAMNHGHTYQAHPQNCAAALAVQRIIRRDKLVEMSAAKGEILGTMLREAFGNCSLVGDIRGRGLFWTLEFVEDRSTKKPLDPALAFGSRLHQKTYDFGVAVYPGQGTVDGVEGDHVLIAPPFTVTVEELELIVTTLKKAYDGIVAQLQGLDEQQALVA